MSYLEETMLQRVAHAVLIFSAFVAPALGQIGTAALVGRVSDTSGAVISGAEVQVSRLATNEVFRTTTTTTGDYTLASLPVGAYELRVSVQGFKSEVRTGIVLEIGQTYRIDTALGVGSITETVDVQSTAPILKTESPVFGQVIDNSKINNLPLNSRDVLGTLSILTPGAAPARNNRLGGGLDVNVRGQRRSDNVLMVDGTLMSQGNAATTFNLNPDAVQEFEVKTGLYGAEYGIKPGGQFSLITKSGTNQFHGTAFEFLRNNKLDARNFFDLGPRSKFRRNQFGGVLGGPVLVPKIVNGKDRIWFFFAYGGERVRQASPLSTNVPTPDEKTGRFSRTVIDPLTKLPFPNNTIPANRISPISAKFLDFWPDPNTTGRGFNFTSPNSVNRINHDQYVGKLDIKVTDNDRISGRTLYDNSPIYINNVIPQFYGYEPFATWSQEVTDTHTFRARLVNELSGHFFRRPFYQGNRVSDTGFGSTLGIKGFPAGPLDQRGVPVLSVFGVATLGDRDNAGPSITGNWEARDLASFDVGSHSLKFGYHYRRHVEYYAFNRRTTFTFDQRYTGVGFADFLLGYPYTVRKAVEDLRGRLNQSGHYAFVQDQWKATSRLTISLGLRYEYRAPLRDQRGFNSNFNFDTGQFDPPLDSAPVQPWQTGRYVANAPLIEWSALGFQPRVGFAYRPLTGWVLRGGYGLYANEPPLGMFQDFGRNPRPNADALVFTGNATTPNITFADPFNTSVVPPGSTAPTLNGFQRNLPNSFVHTWGISVQRELSANTVFEVGYQGSHTVHELTIVSANDATPGPGARQQRRPYPQWQQINFVRPIGTANYNGLEVSLRKRPGPSGLSALASYTYSKALDTVAGRLGVPGDPGNLSRNMTLRQNYGPGEANLPQRFVVNLGYELPFGPGKPMLSSGLAGKVLGGWGLNTIVSLEKGRYFTVVNSSDTLDTGSTNSQRPNVLRNPNLPVDQRTPQRWFDTSAFAAPPPYTYGNAGRGIVEGAGLFNMDLSLLRDFRLTERVRLQFRFEAFNLTNHTNFELPSNSFGSPTFGVVGSALESRDLQMGLKLYF